MKNLPSSISSIRIRCTCVRRSSAGLTLCPTWARHPFASTVWSADKAGTMRNRSLCCSVSSESGLLSDGMKSAAIWGRILPQQYPVPAIGNGALCQNCYLPLLLFLLFFSLFRISWSRVGLDPHQTQPWCWTSHSSPVDTSRSIVTMHVFAMANKEPWEANRSPPHIGHTTGSISGAAIADARQLISTLTRSTSSSAHACILRRWQ